MSKLEPDDATVKVAKSALRDAVFRSTDDNLGRAVSSAIYRMHNSEVARCLIRLVANTRVSPNEVTEEMVEHAARALYESRGKQKPWDVLHDTYKAFWKKGVREALTAMGLTDIGG